MGETSDYKQEVSSHDERILQAQLGRELRKPYVVGARCPSGYPLLILSPSTLEDGSRFPNWSYLTCPRLSAKVAELESAGEIAAAHQRIKVDLQLQEAMLRANEEFKRERRGACEAALQDDVCAHLNWAGQADPLKPKCLHAHVAHALAGIADPLGLELVARLSPAVYESCAQKAFCQKFEEQQ